jgi:hypothetical protein
VFGIKESRLQEIVRETVESVVNDSQERVKRDLDGFKTVAELQDRVTKTREQIETLRIEKERIEEAHARREREVEHKVGLERKRQEFEIAQAKRETELTVREENLTADRKRFEEQMKFLTERFEEEVEYQRELLTKVLERLPSAEIIANLSNAPAVGRAGDE